MTRSPRNSPARWSGCSPRTRPPRGDRPENVGLCSSHVAARASRLASPPGCPSFPPRMFKDRNHENKPLSDPLHNGTSCPCPRRVFRRRTRGGRGSGQADLDRPETQPRQPAESRAGNAQAGGATPRKPPKGPALACQCTSAIAHKNSQEGLTDRHGGRVSSSATTHPQTGVYPCRETARRAQCTNNLKQLGLAVHNYLSANSVFPLGSFKKNELITPCGTTHEQSFLVGLAPYCEQAQVFNAYNSSLHVYDYGNETVHGVGISTLWCPSDPKVSQATDLTAIFTSFQGPPPFPFLMHYNSYKGNSGTWFSPGDADNPGDPFFSTLVSQSNG